MWSRLYSSFTALNKIVPENAIALASVMYVLFFCSCLINVVLEKIAGVLISFRLFYFVYCGAQVPG